MRCDRDDNFSTLVDLLRLRATIQPDARAYTFLLDGEARQQHITYAQLDQKARAIAAWLQRTGKAGERVLLLYPPELEYIAAFFGCLYAGAVAVPAYPPRPNRSISHMENVAADSGATATLTASSLLPEVDKQFKADASLSGIRLLATDELDPATAAAWSDPGVTADTLAFLQYTSGSTGTPKGVMVSHANLLHCEQSILEAFEHALEHFGMGWLPFYHDMGLIGNVLQAVYIGRPCILMAPMAFLQRPFRWLHAISRFSATTSGGPNFAYELCIQKISDEQVSQLDLSNWQVAFTGAEPVRAETIDRFVDKFAPCGFRREAFYPCYGMAEATLIVSGGKKSDPPIYKRLAAGPLPGLPSVGHEDAPPNGRLAAGQREEGRGRILVGCGRARSGDKLLIVDPDTLRPCEDGQVGEIWVSGPCVTQGYWNRPEQTQQTFQQYTADSRDGPFLRTGDLGLLENGELFVTGRMKNVIIIRGRNYYPLDIELTVGQSHPTLKRGGGAAFSVEANGEERLVIANEVERSYLRNLDVQEVVGAIRQAVSEKHDLQVYGVALLKPFGLPRTSSGKIQHHACRTRFLDGSLPTAGQWQLQIEPADPDAGGDAEASGATSGSSTHGELNSAEEIRQWLLEQLSRRLHVPQEEIDVHQPFARYGLDSVSAVGLAQDLQQALGRPVSPTLGYDYPTIDSLSGYLADGPSTAPAEPRETMGTDAEPIAVVGLGLRFPGADSPQEFWRLLIEGVDAISEVPPDRWNADEFCRPVCPPQTPQPDPGKPLPGKMTTRWGGFLENVDQFDPQFFGISPREAEGMDPQQRLLLEVSWEALEHAGMAPDRLAGSPTGVFVGISSGDYSRRQFRDPHAATAYSGTGSALSMAANRLSYVLDLRGPSWAVDTACSSSLVAVHQACQSLRRGECRLALAGGVNLILTPELTITFSQAGMIAPDISETGGRCKTFDEAADGYVRGEGCGVVVLKRLSEATRNNDRILAVISGSAVNQDGRSNGLTAPNGPAQKAVIRQALDSAGLAPAQIDYVEAHGTGTALGDPIELNSLKEILLDGRIDSRPCRVGSVKTNIGHLEAAAGIAGLIKVVLALQHGQIPPQLHFNKLNPRITLDDTPLSIPTRPEPWSAGPVRRAAGVSSFGFGGTNAHVVLQEAPPTTHPTGEIERPCHLLALSAKTPQALRDLAARYEEFLAADPQVPLADVCFSANTGRASFQHRLAIVAESNRQLQDRLQAFLAGEPAEGLVSGQASRFNQSRTQLAFLFTGQGAEHVGMGRQLYDTQPTFRQALDQCDDLLWSYLDDPLLSVLYPEKATDTPLEQTVYAQPALFSLEYALTELWKSWGIEPGIVLGQSLGEYTAACTAGVFSLEDALKLIAEQARLVQSLPRDGLMIDDCGLMKFGRSSFINHQSSIRQIVEPILPQYEKLCAEVEFAEPGSEIVSGTLGRGVRGEIAASEYWVAHLRRPFGGDVPSRSDGKVLFSQGMAALERRGVQVFLEIGPVCRGHTGPTLLAMGRSCLPDGDYLWLPTLRDGRTDWQQMLQSLAALYVRGVAVDWQGFDRGYTRRKIALPTYPFQRRRCWLEAATGASPRPPIGETRSCPTEWAAVSSSGPDHPLLGTQLDSAGSETIFQNDLGKAQSAEGTLAAHGRLAACLQQHRVLDTPVMPAGAFLEMAFQAASRVFATQTPSGSDLVIGEALAVGRPGFLEDHAGLVQLVLSPADDGTQTFGVFSRPHAEGSPWRRKASGTIRPPRQSAPPQGVDLQALRDSCPEELPVDAFYRLARRQGLDYGPELRGIRRLWRGEGTCLGEIRLTESSPADAAAYCFHPALMDACMQVLGGVYPAPDGTFMVVGVEQFRVFRSPGATVWSHAARGCDGPSDGSTRLADVRVFDESGQPIAELLGVRLKRLRGDVLLAGHDNVDRCFYDLRWRPQPPARTCSPSENAPRPAEICKSLRQQLGELGRKVSLDDYRRQLPKLETLSVGYITQALRTLGWSYGPGDRIAAEQVATHLGVADSHRRLFSRLLEILAEEGFLAPTATGWEVCRRLGGETGHNAQQRDPQAEARALKDSFPAADTELTLLDRCGSALAEVLRGRSDPLELMFPDGDLTLARKLYQDSPGARVMNDVVVQAVKAILENLPQGRRLRILEIGAGTGGTTAAILPHLPPGRCEYVLTDVSPLLTAKAQERFHEFPFVRYEVLDVERSPRSQGLQPHHYDLVIGANVLHATRDLSESLQNARELLVPGGMLLLLEGTTRQRWLDLIFGLTDGWWRFADTDLRPDYPLLPAPQWSELLGRCGFAETEIVAPDPDETGQDSPQAAILARTDPSVGHEAAPPNGRAGDDSPDRTAGGWLLLADRRGVGERLAELLRARRAECTLAYDPDQLDDLLLRLTGPGRPPLRGIAHLWSLDEEQSDDLDQSRIERGWQRTCGSAIRIVRALAEIESDQKPSLWLVTAGAQAVEPAAPVPGLAQSPLWGLGQVVALEHPELNCVRVDLDPQTGREPAEASAETLLREIVDPDREDQVAFRDSTRHVARLVRTEAPPPHAVQLRPDATYLITGGLGALGLRTARWLAERGARHLVLLGREGLPRRDQWDGLARNCRTRRQVEAVSGIEELGAQIEVISADVADLDQMSDVFARISDAQPPIRGVIHAAGVADYQPIAGMSLEALARVLRPKVLGAWVLKRLTWQLELDFLVCYSSTASLWGVKGQGHYAAANRFLDAFAHDCRAARSSDRGAGRVSGGLPVLTVNWGLWSGGGMVDEAYRAWLAETRMEQPESEPPAAGDAVPTFDAFGGCEDESYRAWLSKIGVEQLQTPQAFDALGRLLGSGAVQSTVAEVDWEKFTAAGQLTTRPPLLQQVLSEPAHGAIDDRRLMIDDCRIRNSSRLRSAHQSSIINHQSNERRHDMLITYFRDQIAQVLGLDSSQLDVDQPLNTVGLDSLMAIELRNQVKTDLGVDVPMVAFIEGPSVSRMATLISEQLAAAADRPQADQPSTPPAAPEDTHTPQDSPQSAVGTLAGSPGGGNGQQQAGSKPIREPEWIEGEI